MRLIEYQLKNTLTNIEQIRKAIDSKKEQHPEDMDLENWHYELLDLELRTKDMIKNIDKISDHFINIGETE